MHKQQITDYSPERFELLREFANELSITVPSLSEYARNHGFKVYLVIPDRLHAKVVKAIDRSDKDKIISIRGGLSTLKQDKPHQCSICKSCDHISSGHYAYQRQDKPCTRCKRVLSLSDFPAHQHKRADGQIIYYPAGHCKSCDHKISKSYRESNAKRRLRWLLSSMIARCKKRNILCTLTINDLVSQYEKQNGLCFYSHIPMKLTGGNDSISIDRVDPFGAYSPDNIVITTWLVNHMKRQQTSSEFVALCKKISETYPHF